MCTVREAKRHRFRLVFVFPILFQTPLSSCFLRKLSQSFHLNIYAVVYEVTYEECLHLQTTLKYKLWRCSIKDLKFSLQVNYVHEKCVLVAIPVILCLHI